MKTFISSMSRPAFSVDNYLIRQLHSVNTSALQNNSGWNVRNHVMKPTLAPMEHNLCSYRDMTSVMGTLIPSIGQEMIVPITAFRTHKAYLSLHETLYISDTNFLQKNVSEFFPARHFLLSP